MPGMEHDDLNQDDELDSRLRALFRAVEQPAPRQGFEDRTLRTVMRQPLPAGRRRLRSPLAGLLGWAALIAGVAVSASVVAMNAPVFATAFAAALRGGVGAGVWLLQFAGAGIALADVFSAIGRAMSHVVATREGTTALVLIAAVGALSLSALHRLLISEGTERGVSQWQEL